VSEPFHTNDPRPQGGSANPLTMYPQPDGTFWVSDRHGYLCTCDSWLTLMRLLHAARERGDGTVLYSGAREFLFPGSHAKLLAEHQRICAKLREDSPKSRVSATASGEDLLSALGLA